MESQKRECLGYVVKLENVGVHFNEELLKFRRCGHWGEARISYRKLIFENLKPVKVIKKSFEHHLNILKKV